MTRFERASLVQSVSRRAALTAFASAAGAFATGDALAQTTARAIAPGSPPPPLFPAGADQTVALQTMIDANAPLGRPVVLPPGPVLTGPLTLRPGTILTGNGATRLVAASANPNGGPLLSAKDAPGLRLSGLTIDGNWRLSGAAKAVVAFTDCPGLMLDGLTLMRSSGHGIALAGCTGRIERCQLTDILDAAIFSLDGRMAMTSNTIEACGNNGILVWRSAPGEDASEISGNRISRIRADGGGTGQNGNGINVFRSGAVRVHGNTISDCAYSAVRGNAASNLLIQANTCLRLGEVALYCEYALPKAGSEPRPGFEGAIVANNIVDRAATGISVTNFSEGGRLAVVQGNLIRNLFRRELEPVDTRGHGICVEADANVTGNTVENAPTAGILVGWGRHMRDVSITGNLIRTSRNGVLVSSDAAAAGRVLVAHNVITGATDGAIRAHNRGRVSGPDLAREPDTRGRVTIMSNVSD